MQTNMRESSLEAYYDLGAYGQLERQERRIIDIMDSGRWYSRRELAALTMLETSTISARVNHLIERDVLLESAERSPCVVTGRMVFKVWLAPAQKALELS